MNLEDTIKRNNAIMQNVADKMDALSKNKKTEGTETKEKNTVLEEIKKGLDNHYKNISDVMTKLVKTSQNNSSEVVDKETSLKIDDILKTLTDYVNKDEARVHIHKKQIILFGKDSSLTTKSFLLMVGILIILVSSLKYLPPFFDHFSNVKKERDTYQIFYRYHYLRFIKESNNQALENIENQLKLIQNQDSSFMQNYNDMEEWLKKDLQIKSLKDQLKEIEHDS